MEFGRKIEPMEFHTRPKKKLDQAYKFQAITAAKGLLYSKETIDKIEAANSDAEITIIMASARKKRFGC